MTRVNSNNKDTKTNKNYNIKHNKILFNNKLLSCHASCILVNKAEVIE